MKEINVKLRIVFVCFIYTDSIKNMFNIYKIVNLSELVET